MLKVFGDMVSALLGSGCRECGAKDNLMICEYCKTVVCKSCLDKDVNLRTRKCKGNPVKGDPHRFLNAEE